MSTTPSLICRQLLKKHTGSARVVTLLSGALGSGKTYTAQMLVRKHFELNPNNAQILYIAAFNRKRAMDLLLPGLPSFSSKLHVETPASFAEKVMQYSISEFYDQYQVLRTPQERYALFIANLHALPLNIFRHEHGNTASLVLDYLQDLKQCNIDANEFETEAKLPFEFELLQCKRVWDNLLAKRHVLEKEDLLTRAFDEMTNDAGSGKTLLKSIWNYTDSPLLIVDDVHLLKPIQLRLIHAIMPLCAETLLLFDEQCMDSFSPIMPIMRNSLALLCQQCEVKEFQLPNRSAGLIVEKLPTAGVDTLLQWVAKQAKSKRRVVVCTRFRHERDKLYEMLHSRKGKGMTTKFYVKTERGRLIQSSEVQAMLAMLTLVLASPPTTIAGKSASLHREWFVVFTNRLFPKYCATPAQIKEFGQRLTRQRMEPKAILQQLTGTNGPAQLLQDVEFLQTLMTSSTISLSTLCMEMLKRTGVDLEPYSASSERIAALFDVLKRIEFNNTESIPLQMLESLKTVLEHQADEDVDADENDTAALMGDDDDEDDTALSLTTSSSVCEVATIQQVCQQYDPKTIDRLCFFQFNSKPLWKSTFRRLPLPPTALLDAKCVESVFEEDREHRLMHSLYARSKNNIVYTCMDEDDEE